LIGKNYFYFPNGCNRPGKNIELIDVEAITHQVLHNCDISDAQHAGLYSTCGLALRLRDLYKWERRLNPWEEKDSSEILDWIDHKEQLWEKLAEAEYADLSIDGRQYHPFDTSKINAALEPHRVLYGAGYAYSLKPTFFLAEIENKEHTHGHIVYTLGRELARDLLTLPALSQDNMILLRTESARLFLWDQIVYIKKSARPALQFALQHCGLKEQHPAALRLSLPLILAAQKNNYIHHEIGEMRDSTFHTPIWREIIGTYPHTTVELLTRALKDLLADTNEQGTLRYLTQNRKTAGLGLYAAFLDGLQKQLFPELSDAFKTFTQTRNWHIIEEAAAAGYSHAKNYADQMIKIFLSGKEKMQPKWAKDEIEHRLLAKLNK
jgi:hypothetical protein